MRVSNSLDPDQAQHYVGPDLITVRYNHAGVQRRSQNNAKNMAIVTSSDVKLRKQFGPRSGPAKHRITPV